MCSIGEMFWSFFSVLVYFLKSFEVVNARNCGIDLFATVLKKPFHLLCFVTLISLASFCHFLFPVNLSSPSNYCLTMKSQITIISILALHTVLQI